MKNKAIKISLIAIGILAMAYGAFKITDVITGTVRLKYATFKVKNYEDSPISSEEIE